MSFKGINESPSNLDELNQENIAQGKRVIFQGQFSSCIMNIRTFIFLLVFPALGMKAQQNHYKLIPAPLELYHLPGDNYDFSEPYTLVYDSLFVLEADYFAKLWQPSIGNTKPNVVRLLEQEGYREEQYTLEVENQEIVIRASQPKGAMRAIQTLRQLAALQNSSLQKAQIPALQIEDQPVFSHRGMLIDVCRHFFPLEALKKQIDVMAFYKMNVLHLHLTEDQAWRMESEAFPKLNSHSAWRTEADGSRYGGYYTKSQLRELVAYAAQRHITIIPEIELPGHAQAALSAYPEFSCLGPGAQIQVANDWGVFKEIYCAGRDSSFWFLETVLKEVMEVFPSTYIHIGGDEAPKFRWEHCDRCQARINEEGLSDEHELQAYFIQRIEAFLQANGRQLIGWDEILEGGLSPTATVQSWRGMEGGIAAAKAGNKTIMSPTSHCYLDYGLDRIDLAKIYSFDPIPPSLSPSQQNLIIGGECNMWTEHVPTEKALDQKIHPRMEALAEVLWSYPGERDFEHFYQRIQAHYPILEGMGVDYGPETIPATIYADAYPDSQKVMIGAIRNLKDLEMQVFWNNEIGPWGFRLKEDGVLKVKAYKGNRLYSDSIQQTFSYHQALAAKLEYDEPYSRYYPAGGDFALVNGRLGSLNFRDGQWQGFAGRDVEITLRLDSLSLVDSVAANFYHYNNAWIFIPQEIQIEYSADGKRWKNYGRKKPQFEASLRGQHIETICVQRPVAARYIKLKIKSQKRVPDWHEAAGSEAWVFIDEIIVR